jgi:hypothetical protein
VSASTSPLERHARFDGFERLAVERLGVVDDAPVRQRTEARVEVVEALVDQAKRNDLQVESVGEVAVRLERRADAVAAPYERLAGLEERVALALEGPAPGQLDDAIAVLTEPLDDVPRLGVSLREAEAGRNERLAVYQAGVRRERHVGEAVDCRSWSRRALLARAARNPSH